MDDKKTTFSLLLLEGAEGSQGSQGDMAWALLELYEGLDICIREKLIILF